MREEEGVPWLDHDSGDGLGVRVPIDIRPDRDGRVRPADPSRPRGKGMSVCPDEPERMYDERKPRAMGGRCPLALWKIEEERLGNKLRFRADSGDLPRHGVVEPAYEMLLQDYRVAIQDTRESWILVLRGRDEG